MNRNAKTRWSVVSLAIASGVIAGMQIGKVAPALGVLRVEFEMSLVTGGWFASILNIVGALLAVAAGTLADRSGAERACLAGLSCLLLGSFMGATTDSISMLMFSRSVEGLGFLLIVVAAPRLIVANSSTAQRTLTLGLWSTYMPVGVALGMVTASIVLSSDVWRTIWSINITIIALFLILFFLATRNSPKQANSSKQSLVTNLREAGSNRGPWLLAICFGTYALQWFALMTWLPTILYDEMGFSSLRAGLLSALVVVSNVVGNTSGAWLLHRNIKRWWLIWCAYAVMILCSIGVFSGFGSPQIKILLAIIFSATGGLLPAALLSATGTYAPTAAHVGTVNGIVVQGSNLGILAGAPMLAWTVQYLGGWSGAWMLMLIMGLIGSFVALALRHFELYRLN